MYCSINKRKTYYYIFSLPPVGVVSNLPSHCLNYLVGDYTNEMQVFSFN